MLFDARTWRLANVHISPVAVINTVQQRSDSAAVVDQNIGEAFAFWRIHG
jgi:hypothetical protein